MHERCVWMSFFLHRQVIQEEPWSVRREVDWPLFSAADYCDLQLIKNTSSVSRSGSLWAAVLLRRQQAGWLITWDTRTLTGSWKISSRRSWLYPGRKNLKIPPILCLFGDLIHRSFHIFSQKNCNTESVCFAPKVKQIFEFSSLFECKL